MRTFQSAEDKHKKKTKPWLAVSAVQCVNNAQTLFTAALSACVCVLQKEQGKQVLGMPGQFFASIHTHMQYFRSILYEETVSSASAWPLFCLQVDSITSMLTGAVVARAFEQTKCFTPGRGLQGKTAPCASDVVTCILVNRKSLTFSLKLITYVFSSVLYLHCFGRKDKEKDDARDSWAPTAPIWT